MIRKGLVVSNWKMHGSIAFTKKLIGEILPGLITKNMDKMPELVICPPFVYLEQVWKLFSIVQDSPILLGAQDLSLYSEGAYTGQISASMLVEKHCQYVIVGHSERRQYCAETNEVVAGKMLTAINAALTPIVCLGETLCEKQAKQTEQVILKQLGALLDKGGIESMQRVVLAYEPIWAIGTGETATPAQVQVVHELIRTELAKKSEEIADLVRILYGGSVKPENASELFSKPDIDGGLIGGASLKAKDFLGIVAAVEGR